MRRRLQRVCGDEVVGVPQYVRRVKDEEREQDGEEHENEAVLHRVVRVERHRVLLSLHVDAERVVVARNVQRPNVKADDTENDEGDQVVQREEALQRRVVDAKAAPKPFGNAVADHRDGAENVGDDGRAPRSSSGPTAERSQGKAAAIMRR